MSSIKFSMILMGCVETCSCNGNHGIDIGKWRTVSVDSQRVCYSFDKSDVLSDYHIGLNESGKDTVLTDSGYYHVHLSYPHTCININLKPGNQYYTVYKLNGVKYRYEFIIDNTWNVLSLKQGLK